jgi:hypothetical protein
MSRIRYGKTIASCAAVAILAIFFTLVLTHTGGAKPRPAPRPQVGSLPNEVGREGIKPGNYATAINVHNPSLTATVTIDKRAVVAPPEQTPPQQVSPSAFQSYSLGPGYAVEVDCADITGLLGGNIDLTSTFIKGFVTILTRMQPLDVVGVYSAEPPSVTISYTNAAGTSTNETEIPGIALEMLDITPRIEVLGPVAVRAPIQVYEYSAKFLCGEAIPPGSTTGDSDRPSR